MAARVIESPCRAQSAASGTAFGGLGSAVDPARLRACDVARKGPHRTAAPIAGKPLLRSHWAAFLERGT